MYCECKILESGQNIFTENCAQCWNYKSYSTSWFIYPVPIIVESHVRILNNVDEFCNSGTCIAFLLMNIYCRCDCIHLCDMCLFAVGWEDYWDHTAVQCRWGHHSVYRGPCRLLQQLSVLWQYGSLHHLLCRVTRCTGSWEGKNYEECDHPLE